MVNYPKGQKRNYATQKTSQSGRGMELESDLNKTNTYYLEEGLAVIYKKPTPITIVKVDYPARSAAKITEAYFKLPSTTDYNGLYRGRYIDFEAKECASLTSFPLSSIHEHQLQHLDRVVNHGGIAFVIIRFTKVEETYLVKAEDLLTKIQTLNRKSIPYAWFQEVGYLIPMNYIKPVDYLRVVDELYFRSSE